MSSDPELSALSHLTPSLLCAMVVTPSGRLAMRLCNGARSEYFWAPEDMTSFVSGQISLAEARYAQRILDRQTSSTLEHVDLASLGLLKALPQVVIKRRF